MEGDFVKGQGEAVSATVVVALDHMLRGMFWPQSVYGVMVASQWRWIEHAAWVVFEDIFLVMACLRSLAEMRETADRTAALEHEVPKTATMLGSAASLVPAAWPPSAEQPSSSPVS